MDPIAELVRDLNERGKPSMAWVVTWSQDGRDPVESAWEECRDFTNMVVLLGIHYGYASTKRNLAYETGLRAAMLTAPTRPGFSSAEADELASSGACAIRYAGIKPPTLADLLAAHGHAQCAGTMPDPSQ